MKHRNNRLYLVNLKTNEYTCFAKSFGMGWNLGNVDNLDYLLTNTDDGGENPLFVINEDEFTRQKIGAYCRNVNYSNCWRSWMPIADQIPSWVEAIFTFLKYAVPAAILIYIILLLSGCTGNEIARSYGGILQGETAIK